MKRSLLFCIAIILALPLTACGTKAPAAASSALSVSPTPETTIRPEDVETGNTTIHEGGKKIGSEEIVSFSLNYDLTGFYEEENERVDVCRSGRYILKMESDEKGQARCSLDYKDPGSYYDPVSVQFTAEPEAFAELQRVLTDAGIIAINGFSGWDSALGTYVNLKAKYATGETLSVYGEGGASAFPPADIDAVIVFFNELAETNGCRFTHLMGRSELMERFRQWVREIMPSEVDTEAEEAEWLCEDYDDRMDLYVSGDGSAFDGWGAYARYLRSDASRTEGYYYYDGVNEKDELLRTFLTWLRENAPGAGEREGETLRIVINFKRANDRLQMICRDRDENELWEAYADLDRSTQTISNIEYYQAAASGESGEITFDEEIHLGH